MSRTTAVVLGILTLWPVLYLVAFIVFLGIAAGSIGPDGELPDSVILGDTARVLHPITALLIGGMLIFYIEHAFRKTHMTRDRKYLWTVLLLVGSVIAMPAYWYLQVWKDHSGRRA
jgi:hypothetical protein